MEYFDYIAATQDWHPDTHVSFANNHIGKKPFETIELPDFNPPIQQILWPDHCIRGSYGAKFHPSLDDTRIDLVVRKGKQQHLDSYSAFFENDHTTSTGLEYYLKGLGISEVYLTGLASDICVYYSAKDAVEIGFRTYLVEDATRGIDNPPGTLEKRMKELEEAGVRMVTSRDIMKHGI